MSVFIIVGVPVFLLKPGSPVKILEGHFAFKHQVIHDFKNVERLRRSYWLASELTAWI